MTREPVAFDFIDVEAAHGKFAYGSIITSTLVRPIPSVRESHRVGPLSMSRMSFVPERVQTRDNKRDNGFFSRPLGLCRPPWVNKHVMAGRLQAEETFGVTVATSLKQEGVEGGPSVGHSPENPSHHTTLRNVARMPPSGEDSRLGAHQSTLSGTEPSSVTHQNPSSSYSPGFGSPLYKKMKGNGVPTANQSLPNLQQLQAAAHALARLPGTGKSPHTAQLTIFYAGMVNVYDDVPFDKAQAIMLLAGTGSACSSSNYMNLPGASGRPFSTPMSHPTSRAGSPTLQMANTPSATAPSPVVPIAINRQMPTTTTGLIACAVELPQARKASLARFLEKRKDRVRKRPYTDPRINEELARNSRENSPCPPSNSTYRLARPLSPPAAKNQSNVPMFTGGALTSGSGPSSVPQTSPRLGMSEDHRSSHGMPEKSKETELSMETMAARSGKLSPSPSPSSSPPLSLSPSRGVAVVASNSTEPMDHEHSS